MLRFVLGGGAAHAYFTVIWLNSPERIQRVRFNLQVRDTAKCHLLTKLLFALAHYEKMKSEMTA